MTPTENTLHLIRSPCRFQTLAVQDQDVGEKEPRDIYTMQAKHPTFVQKSKK